MAEAKIIDGKAFAERLRGRIAEEVAELKREHGVQPGLAVVLVGEDPASKIYVRSKEEQTEQVGMRSIGHKLPAGIGYRQAVDVLVGIDLGHDRRLLQVPGDRELHQDAVDAAVGVQPSDQVQQV